MKNVFLEVFADESTEKKFDHYLEKFYLEKSDNGNIIFCTEDDYCDCLAELENQLNITLAQYWVQKSEVLLEQNAQILRLITILNKANIKQQASITINQILDNTKRS